MPSTNEVITDQIKRLELQLLHSDSTVLSSLLEVLLAKEFEEIGSHGNVSPRQEVVDWLLNKSPEDRWLLTDFRVKELSAGMVLAIYHAEQIAGHRSIASKGSVRSSIWRHNTQGWQMVFHQATKII